MHFSMDHTRNRLAKGKRLWEFFLGRRASVLLFFYRLAALIILISLGGIALLGIRAFLYRRSLPLVGSPVAFVKAFKPLSHPMASLAPTLRCKAFQIFCHGTDSEYVESPLFPPRRQVEVAGITAGTCETVSRRDLPDANVSKEERLLYTDRLWDVFWIAIFTCGSPDLQGGYFGPYRTL